MKRTKNSNKAVKQACNKTAPKHPGTILKNEYLDPIGITQQELADYLGITRVRINEVILGKRAITPDTAIRLARFFDTTVKYWLEMQTDLDLWEANKNNEGEYSKIQSYDTITIRRNKRITRGRNGFKDEGHNQAFRRA